ncbi:hypothetical protein BDV93DRAFT_542055 [Ceratobasidium sp. AG-I]|nr:hypothetical protein BDV93DRAFT_542055 [Ceratobasidium sp. AG-I]
MPSVSYIMLLFLFSSYAAARMAVPHRRVVDTCANINIKLQLPLPIQLQVCACLGQVDTLVKSNVALSAVVGKLGGIANVTALVTSAIDRGTGNKTDCNGKCVTGACSSQLPSWSCSTCSGKRDELHALVARSKRSGHGTPNWVRRSLSVAHCPAGTEMCGVYGRPDAWECLNVNQHLESCGGCAFSFFPGQKPGMDCSELPGVDSVECQTGKCLVHKCQENWTVSADGHSCEARSNILVNRKILSTDPFIGNDKGGSSKADAFRISAERHGVILTIESYLLFLAYSLPPVPDEDYRATVSAIDGMCLSYSQYQTPVPWDMQLKPMIRSPTGIQYLGAITQIQQIKKAKQKAKQKAHHYADKLLGSTSLERVGEQSSSGSINSSETKSSIDTPPSTRSQPDLSDTGKEPSSFHVSESASIASSSPGRNGKRTAWFGLKTLIGLLNEGTNKFGPLKSAFGEILGCIEIYERAAKGREDYKTLRDELDSLFEELSGYLGGSAPPAMTSSLKNLAKGIEREIGFVQGKGKRSALGRVAEAMEDADEIFKCYRRIERLLARVTFNANINTWKAVDEQATQLRLRSLSPSLAAQYASAESTDLRRNGCTLNTRVDLLNRLKAWAEDGSSKRIYWLNGMAGTGKTTIAYSLCDQLESNLTLAASFFCSRQLPACRNVTLIIPTVAYQLARFSLPFRHALSKVLEQAPDIRTLKVSKQFQKLIVEPLLEIESTMPSDLVVVIDALDECDSKDGVDQILEALLSHPPGLPIKFFMTSRPEAEIQDQMHSGQSRGIPEKLDLHNLDRSVVREDIKTYLKVKLDSPRLSLTDTNLERLVDQSGVLFIHAATVVRYIGVSNFSRSTKRLAQVLAASTSLHMDTTPEVDTLYGDILRAALDDKTLNNCERQEMRDVLHTVICAQEPLTVSVIATLLKLDIDSVQAALRPLNSVLHLSYANGVVTSFHESFPDYMLDKHRSGPFYCDSHGHNALLAHRCFGLIEMRNPPFNICDLESSYVFDKDVPDLDRRVETIISDEVFYAYRYWGPHLVLANPLSNLLDALHDFLSVRLLLWMEVMNLKQCISTGVGVLHRVQSWLQRANSSDDVQELALDAWGFALEFSTSPMSRSTPHIYMSALPFWPDHRPISTYYLPKMQGLSRLARTVTGKRKTAPLAVCTTHSSVASVAYSFNSTRIVSGASDGTIQIWDADTGQPVGEPLEGHSGSVFAVTYSHDGTRIASGSADNTVRIWDAHTGEMVGEPLEGHTDWIRSVAYSPDSTHIVSGSDDNTLRIWDVHTGHIVGEPLEGHSGWVYSVAYSPNGIYIVSGSDDNTLRIWDAHTGQTVGEPLEGHTGPVYSATYSHDSACIVSSSQDATIRTWDARTRQMMGEPLRGHISSVWSAAYSPGSANIVSASADKTVRIWDAHTGEMVGEPLEGHTGSVLSVAYSHDGARIISSSQDTTIRTWDSYTSNMVDGMPDTHCAPMQAVRQSAPSQDIVAADHAPSVRSIIVPGPEEGQALGVLLAFNPTPSNRSTDDSHADWTLDEDGWVLGDDSKLLIWVPPEMRRLLLLPRTLAIIPASGLLALNFSNAKLGEDWHHCYCSELVLPV